MPINMKVANGYTHLIYACIIVSIISHKHIDNNQVEQVNLLHSYLRSLRNVFF